MSPAVIAVAPPREHIPSHLNEAWLGFGPGGFEGSAVALFLFFVVDAVEADRDADHQRVVLPRGDIDTVGVADAEPGAGDPPHDLAAVADLELLVDDVADGLQAPAVGQVDAGPVMQRRNTALCTVAITEPSRSTSMASVKVTSFCLISARLRPEASWSSRVCRSDSTLASTKNARLPSWSVTQKSSLMEKSRSRTW